MTTTSVVRYSNFAPSQLQLTFLGSSSTRPAALLLSRESTFEDAQKNCTNLKEELFRADKQPTENLTSYINYLNNRTQDRLFWVDGKSDSLCNAVNITGHVVPTNCSEQLSALCSQNAPIANAKDNDDTNPTWRIKVLSGNQSFNGYDSVFDSTCLANWSTDST